MSEYEDLFSRNIGFFTEAEQLKLKHSRVLVIGVGGMGGVCLQSLVRAGVQILGFADFDKFEASNINRQVFCDMTTIGHNKCLVTQEKLLAINPELKLEVLDENWLNEIDNILSRYDVVVNCMDDFYHTIMLFRKCREHGVAVIDSYNLSPFPSVFIVKPSDPMPEERLGYCTKELNDIQNLSEEALFSCKLKEITYILTHTTAINYVDINAAEEVIKGNRPRFSFSAMVATAGNMMAYETIFFLLNKRYGTDFKGYFFNPYQGTVEKEKGFIRVILKKMLVKKFLSRYIN